MSDRCDGRGRKGGKGCGAPIEWVVVASSGKAMPIDPDPVQGGNLIKGLEPLPDGRWTVTYLRKGEQADSLLGPRETYVSHFATCPNAEEFRVGASSKVKGRANPARH